MEMNFWESAAAKTENGNTEMEGKYLTFWTDGQLFGVPIADVVQIVGMQGITTIPDYPYYAKGIINLRGSIIPVTDVRLRLGRPEADYTDRTCIIVTNIRDRFFGFIVDQVNEVADIADEQVSSPPEMAGTGSQFLTGVAQTEEALVLLIDTARLLGDEGFELLSASM